MEYCEDSPKKKKRRKSKPKNPECIIHVRENVTGEVTPFSGNSWMVC